MSSLASSPVGQVPLRVGKTTIAIAICYEVAYPQIVRRRAHKAELLVVLSEDSWLGDTTGPWQHLQIARMRALELGKYLVRVTNDGVTAIVDQRARSRANWNAIRWEYSRDLWLRLADTQRCRAVWACTYRCIDSVGAGCGLGGTKECRIAWRRTGIQFELLEGGQNST